MDKSKIISTFLIALAVVLAARFLGNAYKMKYHVDDAIEVTGLGKKDFDSDLIVWNGGFSRQDMEMKTAYAQLNSDREIITKYLLNKGIKKEEMLFEAIDIQPQYDYEYDDQGNSHRVFNGYKLYQSVKVEAKNSGEEDRITLVETVARDVTELINDGLELYSGSPLYYYTKLEELKIEMIAAATENARHRAEQIAENSGSDLGYLKKANMGVFQILGRNENEEYSWGGTFNTGSRQKTAQITMKLKFAID
jgi:hypothetical protein